MNITQLTQAVDPGEKKQTIATLNRLLAACRDSRHMYGAASQDARSRELGEIFLQHAHHRDSLVREVEAAIQELGGKPEAGETVAGSLLRGWMDILAGFVADHDHAVLVECERAERRLIGAYEKALAEPMHLSVEIGLRRQFQAVRNTHLQIMSLRDLPSKAG
jgi:uncharacterized protein (TIGR02284 family)